jgi:Arc/MetJ-type ribon-helix-helix transcriptional regulator
MTTISVPINAEQEEFIKRYVKSGRAANKAHAVRRAIDFLAEEEFYESFLRAKEDVRAGRVYGGDLRGLVKKFRA